MICLICCSLIANIIIGIMTNKIRRILFYTQIGYLCLTFCACVNNSQSKFYSETDITSVSDSLNAVRFDGKSVTIDASGEFGNLINGGQIILKHREFDSRSGPTEFDGCIPSDGTITHNKNYVIIAARYFDDDIRILLKGDNGVKGWTSIRFTSEFREFANLHLTEC